MPKVLVPIAQGSEELEAVTIIDILRRAQVEVTVAGLEEAPVRMSRGVVIVPDMPLAQALALDFDMIVLPGGLPGAEHLGNDPRVTDLVRQMAANGKYTCAICAAPRVLALAGVLEGRKVTAYPGFIDNGEFPGVAYTGGAVQQDGKVITSRGPGTALDFALHLVEVLCGDERRRSVEDALVRG
ncbi:MAG: DJ-1/PfpI family protein [Candidatus Hydrogenedentes bacterium]|nr:DJ-1/PfpI family protein [Candidatus Hydrogenedentota bacterium]